MHITDASRDCHPDTPARTVGSRPRAPQRHSCRRAQDTRSWITWVQAFAGGTCQVSSEVQGSPSTRGVGQPQPVEVTQRQHADAADAAQVDQVVQAEQPLQVGAVVDVSQGGCGGPRSQTAQPPPELGGRQPLQIGAPPCVSGVSIEYRIRGRSSIPGVGDSYPG